MRRHTALKKLIRRSLQILFASRATQFLAKAGYHICLGKNGSHRAQRAAINQLSEAFIAELRNELAINCVIDVGANEGQFGGSLRRAGYEGLILSFEPNNDAFESLTLKSRNDGHWNIYPLALGSEECTRAFNFTSHSVFSSFLTPNNLETPQFEDGNRISRTENVRIRRLDLFMQELDVILPDNPRYFLKMDTQGFDLEVMRGAGAFLDQIHAIQSEISMVPIYEGMPYYLESLREYESLGFAPATFLPVNRQPDSLITIEMDCIMIKRPLRSQLPG